MNKALASILLVAAVQGPAWAAAADPAVEERLLAGEVVARESQSDAAGASARMQVLARAPARALWEVIVSCDMAFAFVEGLQYCAVLDDTGERVLVHQVVDQGWLTPTYDFVFESLRRPYERIDVHLVEGNLRALDGRWVFREAAEGTLIDYQLHIQPSLPAPRFIVRRNLGKGMPDMLACIRGLAGGSGSEARQRDDLDRCPGALPAGRPNQ